MTTVIEAAHILFEGGWASPGHVAIDDQGFIVGTSSGPATKADVKLSGYVVPGVANLHSHAHHRGLVGYADLLHPGRAATLWSWREAMYGHLEELEPEDLEAYATLSYIEMLRRGFTSVGEFHYIHHDPKGARYTHLSEMSERIVAAAETAGIALTILPTFYTSGGVGRPSEAEQHRFTTTLEEFNELLAALDNRAQNEPLLRVGIAPHSLRAVRQDELSALLSARPHGPVHIHAAERTEEVDEIVAGLGARPVEWLLDNAAIDERWCVVHATHMIDAERRRLAASGAVAGLCPLTEANLGDGRFPLAAYRQDGGRFGVGTDANHLIDLPGELRILEYGQRLASHRRETLLTSGESSVGATLFGLAREGGARALDQPSGVLRAGMRCDLVELDPDHSALVGQTTKTVLDAWIFSSSSETVVRTVVIGGRVVVEQGRHSGEEESRRRVDSRMRRLHQS